MNFWLKRIFIVGVMLTFSMGAGLFLFRDMILRNVVDARIADVSLRHGLHIAYRGLSMPSVGSVVLEGLSVIPSGRDTLLTLERMELQVGLGALLGGEISLGRVDADGLNLTFVKQKECSNYDFLFAKREGNKTIGEIPSSKDVDYAARVRESLRLVFRMLPANGSLKRLRVCGIRDSLQTCFYISRLNINNSRFTSQVRVKEGTMQSMWQVKGTLDRNRRLLRGQISSAVLGERVVLPYIRPHYHAQVAFDSIALGMMEIPKGDEEQLEGSASVDGLVVHHARLSTDTIELNRVRLNYRLLVEQHAFELDSVSQVIFGKLDFHPYLRISRENQWHIKAFIHRPPFPASDLFASLPAGLFRHLQGIRTEGKLSYNLSADIDFNCLDSLRFSSELKGQSFCVIDLGQSELDKMSREFEYTAYEDDRPVRSFVVGPTYSGFRPLQQISPLLQMAVMQSEDGSFFYHDGFYPGAIQEALAYDLQVGRFARGGSSITMQLVKNVFLNRHKHIARKLEEALIVWLIENQHLTSKERMLEVYLNIIEWGPMVYGAAEACRFYFDKEPSELTPSEAIFLASIIPKPKHFRSVFNADATLRDNQLEYYRLIARRLAIKGMMTEAEADSIRPEVDIKGAARDLILQPDTNAVSSIGCMKQDAEK